MKVKLNYRGQLFVAGSISGVALAVALRSPPLILLCTIAISYLIAYPLMVRNLEQPNIELFVSLRHSILYRGEIEILNIHVINNSNSLIPLAILDFKLPFGLYTINKPSRYIFSLEPSDEQIINVPLLPTARGTYVIGPITVSTGDPFLLFEEVLYVIKEIPFRVYPKRMGSKISKAKTKEVFTKMIGMFSTKLKGQGTDFHHLRDYVRGDPSKIVDWNTTAKRTKLISKEFEEEKKLEIIIALAAGTTTRGLKIDYMLGTTMDIYDGVINENHPVGMVLFDNKLIADFPPSMSQRTKFHIWANIYNLLPKDVYANYDILSQYIEKKGITNHLVIIVGDLEYRDENTYELILECIRNIKLRGNNVIFIDVWGYPFSYETEIMDAAADLSSEDYGKILGDVIGKGISQYNIFRGIDMKMSIRRFGGIYGYFDGPTDNIVGVLDRALYSFFGKKWRVGSK